MTTDHVCKICDQGALERVEPYADLHRVTSDSKPWPPGGELACCRDCGAVQKPATSEWHAEVSQIYDAFELYHQADGAEQPIFDAHGGTSAPRSVRLVDHARDTLRLGETGTLLDFGCGNGDALASFAKQQPGWDLFGAELNDRSLPRLREIPSFQRLYTCPASEIDREFDLVLLIHSLEHMSDPVETLRDLLSSVGDSGHILVEVPDCATTPYDLLVADHLSHFSLSSLATASRRAGYGTDFLSDNVLPKELTWIGHRREGGHAEEATPRSGVADQMSEWVRSQVAWLLEQIDSARSIARMHGQFGVFGTSISATWLSGALDAPIDFFVDEDPGRIGREHMGRPVVAPDNVPEGANVYVPLIPDIARAVASRLETGTRCYHVPAPLERPNL